MHESLPGQLLWMGLAMFLAAVFGAAAKKFNQPKVLGALLAGLLVGVVGTHTEIIHSIRAGHGAELVSGLSEFAAMLLLFKAGLEGNLQSILRDARVGWKVAVIGVVVPMAGAYGYMVVFTEESWTVALFQGGVFAATSVGITAAVLAELKVLDRSFAKTIISAAVIDDVLGLLVLTVCQALAGGVTIEGKEIALKIGGALLFVVVIPIIGHFAAGAILSRMHKVDPSARQAIWMGWMLLYGAGAMYAGLAAIVGAYFAGVALEEVHFTDEEVKEKKGHTNEVEHDLDRFITAFGPVFFVYAGCVVDPAVFLNPSVVGTGLAFTVIAVAGKLAAGLVAGKGQRLLVGVGMVPRGEVGIIFSTIGLSTGILSQELFGASMVMVLLSTVVTPPALSFLIRRAKTPVELKAVAK